MADTVSNYSLGRAAEFYNRVDSNDPANAVLVMLLLAATGLEAHSALRDHATVAAVLAASTNEATNTGYARKILTDADLVAFTPDNTNNRVDLDIPDQTFTGLANDGTGAIGMAMMAYDNDSTSGTDASMIPMTFHDFAVTPAGGDVTVQIPATGFYRAAG